MKDSRRDFLKKSILSSGALGMTHFVPASIKKALSIDPELGSDYTNAEHIVILMQENRSFDHTYGTLKGVRGFNDPRAIKLPNGNPVWCQTDHLGKTYAPFRLDIKDSKITWMGSLPHSRASQVDALNEGKFDQWLIAKRSGNPQYRDMPLTLGHYNRTDLPFHYALADAFTVCDHNFCSGITSTTPNRSYFWTGNILSEENGLVKANIRNDDYKPGKHRWKTFPELLQQNGISWKFYQNDLSTGGGFKGEERSWLANFGCNLLEFFEVYQVKYSKRYVDGLQKSIHTLPDQIRKLQENITTADPTDERLDKWQKDLQKKQSVLDNATTEFAQWNQRNYEKLNSDQKELFARAFTINSKDKNYHSLDSLKYEENGINRELTVPKGDLLYQFREDVKKGQLPTVSWLAGPQNLSDHPSAPWYGAWYVSEILDILTQNPEVWKKTIFIMTYDENDGYFDHVPSFTAPDNLRPETGKCSPGIDTSIEWVRLANELQQGILKKDAREAPIGLGFRVPMVIASPWSRGGKVCSQLFDHTSTLQFLESFIENKYHKKVRIENISAWRRAICGDLTSAFQPFHSKDEKLPFLDWNPFVESIYNAKFKDIPSGYQELSQIDIDSITQSSKMSKQETGTAISCAIPYELYVSSRLDKTKKTINIQMKSGNTIFGEKAVGAPFNIYSLVPYKEINQSDFKLGKVWNYAVKAGDVLMDNYALERFKEGNYNLSVTAPNGYLRTLEGSIHDPELEVECIYEVGKLNMYKPTGNLILKLKNNGRDNLDIVVSDLAYGNSSIQKLVTAGQENTIVLNLKKSAGWYEFNLKVNGHDEYVRKFAGHVETGTPSTTDPQMGRINLV